MKIGEKNPEGGKYNSAVWNHTTQYNGRPTEMPALLAFFAFFWENEYYTEGKSITAGISQSLPRW